MKIRKGSNRANSAAATPRRLPEVDGIITPSQGRQEVRPHEIRGEGIRICSICRRDVKRTGQLFLRCPQLDVFLRVTLVVLAVLFSDQQRPRRARRTLVESPQLV